MECRDFMKAFEPEKYLIKEFQNWDVLVRRDQVTLGDCIIVLRSGKKSFADMDTAESMELKDVLGWYEEKCRTLFGAEKFNYIAAMMRDNFAHFHAFPRYSKPIEKYGKIWEDQRWPRVIQFAPGSIDDSTMQKLINDFKE